MLLWLSLAAGLLAAEAAAPSASPRLEAALLQTRAEPVAEVEDTVPEALWQALESESPPPSDSFRQTLVNFGDAQYIAYLTLGRQMIASIMDTGSYDLVVFGVDCRSCGVAAHYNHHLSHSYSESLMSVEQYYGSGRAISNAAHERLAIGPYRIANQSLWNVKYAQMPILYGAAFEAIFGLGPPDTPMMNAWEGAEKAVDDVLSYYDQGLAAPAANIATAKRAVEMANDATKSPPPLRSAGCERFSVCMGAKPGADGLLVWDDSAASRQPELFSKVSVLGNHSWSVSLSQAGLGYGGTRSGDVLACAEGCQALVDSGTSILSAPSPVVQGLKAAFQNLYPNCSNMEVLPDLVFQLGDTRLSLPPDSYVAMVVPEHPHFLQEAGGAAGLSAQGSAPFAHMGGQGWQCQMLIRETDVNATAGPLWILGMPFFRRYYTTFDLGTRSDERALHVAPHTQDSCEPSTAEAAAAAHEHQMRRVSLSRIRFR